MANPENQRDNDQKTTETKGYNTPINPSERHTGMYEEGDGTPESQPEGGSSKTGPEGAPNQGLEKR
jgi:photosystem I subunit 4